MAASHVHHHRSSAGEAPGAPGAPAPPQYFHEQRRGEVNELKQLLRVLHGSKMDLHKQREAVRKVVAFMTLGIDVSRLFSEMALACATRDLVQKKMVYLYLTTYAESKPDLCLMAVNTLLKDAVDTDPAVRALALRSLCGLRSPAVLEYVEPQLRRGLTDRSSQVRRAAVMGVLRLWHLSPALLEVREPRVLRGLRGDDSAVVDELVRAEPCVESASLVEILLAMLEDADAHVVANVIYALNEILAAQGGLPVTRTTAAALLNRIRDMDEWGQCAVLALMANYTPQTEDELWDFLNLLEERVKHPASAVVLAAAKCFLRAAELKPDLRETIVLRLRQPLLTSFANSPKETAFIVLQHLLHLLRCPQGQPLVAAMSNDFQLFFCGFTDPPWLKAAKLDVLAVVANEATVEAIVDELCEAMATESDAAVAERAVATVGLLARKFPRVCHSVLRTFLSFVELQIGCVSEVALQAVKQILRKFPEMAHEAVSTVERVLPRLDAESRASAAASAIWILSRFESSEAAYLLEDFAERELLLETPAEEGEVGLERVDTALLLEVLNAAVLLFIRQPLQLQPLLSRLLQAYVSSEALSFDVRDRALQSFRLLQALSTEDPSVARQQTQSLLQAMEGFDDSGGEEGGLFREERDRGQCELNVGAFNSLALLYNKEPLTVAPQGITPINFGGKFLAAPGALEAPLDPAEGGDGATLTKEEEEDVIALYE